MKKIHKCNVASNLAITVVNKNFKFKIRTSFVCPFNEMNHCFET